MMNRILHWVVTLACLPWLAHGAEKKAEPPKASPVPDFNPAKQPLVTGEFPVGAIIITFKETAIPGDIGEAITLAHREWYRGHAINLTPNTTYYVRAFATNGLGFRYSDEEKTVKTPDFKTPPASIGPLLTDSFSNNGYLFDEYSNETTETSETFIGYSPTCVLAKLIAYYRPARFASASDSGSKASPVDFNQLSWNPGADDFPMRLEEIDGFFQAVYDQGRQLKLHDPRPGKDFLGNIVKLTGVRSKPVLNTLSPENMKQVSALIRKDLLHSRPVVIVFSYDSETVTSPIRWALIDGINSSGRFHVDFPRNARFFMDGEWIELKSGYCLPEELLLPLYKTLVVTSCYFAK